MVKEEGGLGRRHWKESQHNLGRRLLHIKTEDILGKQTKKGKKLSKYLLFHRFSVPQQQLPRNLVHAFAPRADCWEVHVRDGALGCCRTDKGGTAWAAGKRQDSETQQRAWNASLQQPPQEQQSAPSSARKMLQDRTSISGTPSRRAWSMCLGRFWVSPV